MKKIIELKNICEEINTECSKCSHKEECDNFTSIINDINYLQQIDIGIVPCNWSSDDIEIIKISLE